MISCLNKVPKRDSNFTSTGTQKNNTMMSANLDKRKYILIIDNYTINFKINYTSTVNSSHLHKTIERSKKILIHNKRVITPYFSFSISIKIINIYRQQNNIKSSESSTSVSQSIESDKFINTQRKRNNTKCSINRLEGTIPNINFNDNCIYSSNNISVPTEKCTQTIYTIIYTILLATRPNLTFLWCDYINEEDILINKSAVTYNNTRAHNKNYKYKKLGKQSINRYWYKQQRKKIFYPKQEYYG